MSLIKSGLRRIYRFIPFKAPLYNALRKVWAPSDWLYPHLYFTGPFTVSLIQNDLKFKMYHFGYSFENVIFWKGLEHCWEKRSVRIWEKLCRQANVILDIGANTGVYALIAQTVRPQSEVHTFEPLPKMFDKLKANIELNGYPIHTHALAISDNDGDALLYDLPVDYIRQASLNPDSLSSANLESTTVKTRRLDTFCAETDISTIDLMKVDVETHEPEVFEGMGRLLREQHPIVLVEVLNKTIASRLETIFTESGYQHFYNVDEERGIVKTNDLSSGIHRNYLCTSLPLEQNQDLQDEWAVIDERTIK